MIKYQDTAVYLKRGKYASGGGASLQLIDAVDHCPYATCTVNLEGLEPDEVAIKDYSENEGMLDFLISEEIVKPPHRSIPSGFVLIPVCRLT
jgi:hypothetical protein